MIEPVSNAPDAPTLSELYGLCRPIEYFQSSKKNDINNIYGVLPFVAPEVLRGQSYTLASDIYSFSMIMWGLVSGVSPFNHEAHDFQLGLNICKGKRPKDIGNAPQCYINLMKRCWDECQSKRPTAIEIKKIIESDLSGYYLNTNLNFENNFVTIRLKSEDKRVKKQNYYFPPLTSGFSEGDLPTGFTCQKKKKKTNTSHLSNQDTFSIGINMKICSQMKRFYPHLEMNMNFEEEFEDTTNSVGHLSNWTYKLEDILLYETEEFQSIAQLMKGLQRRYQNSIEWDIIEFHRFFVEKNKDRSEKLEYKWATNKLNKSLRSIGNTLAEKALNLQETAKVSVVFPCINVMLQHEQWFSWFRYLRLRGNTA
ncbi:5000_t:CDS:2 [Funneliformis geosporum]|uniref:5000_t:CDS:1 n=1 Tax=Funneliformis geosporum TaxID=1117311 RepID=A0A9W4SAJ8_9GLOM|nr:5000_t:CDS:2 [Funneliformis geosporum]